MVVYHRKLQPKMTISLQHTPIRPDDHLRHCSSPADGVRAGLQYRKLAIHMLAGKPPKKGNARFCQQTAVSSSLLPNSGIFGDPGGIRTHGLTLRRTNMRSPLLSFQMPGSPCMTGFLTFGECSHFLSKTPNIPRKSTPKLAGR